MHKNKNNIALSVVVVNYNVRYFLEQCILSVQNATKNMSSEIIVVDNNSKDESCTMLKEKFPEVIVIENKINVGFSTANNQGVDKAKGKWILILNPDTVLAEDTLIELQKFTLQKENIGAVTVKFIDGSGNFLPESKRGIPTPKVAFGKLFGFPKRAKNAYYASHINENEIGKVPVLCGAFMYVKKDIYQQVNGFDQDYFMYGEDIDLSYKIEKQGYSNYYFGKAKIIHYKGESTVKNKEYLKRFYGAMEIFYKKHFTVNVIANSVMLVGIKLFFTFKSLSVKNNNCIVKTNNKRILYIGKNDAVFTKIKLKLQPELAVFHQGILLNDIQENHLDKIIFDMNYLTYSSVFNAMEILKNRQISFRFIPPNCSYFIGSDSNESKGEVVQFN